MYVALFYLFFLGIPALVTLAVLKGDVLTHRISGRRFVRSIERELGHRPTRPSWVKIGFVTALGWVAATVAFAPISPTVGVWAGGVVVALGGVGLYRSVRVPLRMGDREFDRRLRELLDQA